MVLGAGKIYLSHKRLKLILPGTDILTVSEMDISLFLKIKTMNMCYTKSEPEGKLWTFVNNCVSTLVRHWQHMYHIKQEATETTQWVTRKSIPGYNPRQHTNPTGQQQSSLSNSYKMKRNQLKAGEGEKADRHMKTG